MCKCVCVCMCACACVCVCVRVCVCVCVSMCVRVCEASAMHALSANQTVAGSFFFNEGNRDPILCVWVQLVCTRISLFNPFHPIGPFLALKLVIRFD